LESPTWIDRKRGNCCLIGIHDGVLWITEDTDENEFGRKHDSPTRRVNAYQLHKFSPVPAFLGARAAIAHVLDSKVLLDLPPVPSAKNWHAGTGRAALSRFSRWQGRSSHDDRRHFTQRISVEKYSPRARLRLDNGMCNTLCITVQLPKEEGGLNGDVIYIDSEGTFSKAKVARIARRFGIDPEKALSRIHLAKVYSAVHQVQMIEQSERLVAKYPIKLIIVDEYFPADSRGNRSTRGLAGQVMTLFSG